MGMIFKELHVEGTLASQSVPLVMASFYDNIAAITARDLVKAWPEGANKSDTVLAHRHLSLTALKHWNYTYYSNETISNGSKCYLVFPPYQPAYLFDNGTFINKTSCYSPVKSIGTRGRTGIFFASAFGVCLVLLLVALAKHGKNHLTPEKRFYPISRRWQWYWGIFVCACACIGLFMGIDIDRYYLQELPITVTVFFWYLLCMVTVALTWESVRHWGSWLERQFIDPNPFVFEQHDRRAMLELWLPMWFYFWVWMNFFLVVPRSWSFTQKQHYPEQIVDVAMPAATSTRFKAGAFCLIIAWLTILFSMRHSIKNYSDRHRGLVNRALGFTKAVPWRFYLTIPITAALIAYQAFIAWEFEYSLIRIGAPNYVIYTWGYTPSLLILLIQILYGFTSPNEDKELIRQRHERNDTIDRELGIVNKPGWWNRVKGEHLMSLRDKIASNVREIGGSRATGRRVEADAERHAREEALGASRGDGIELLPVARLNESNLRADRAGISAIPRAQHYTANRYGGKSEQRRHERVMQTATSVLFPNNLEAERARRHEEMSRDGPAPPPYTDGPPSRNAPGTSRRSSSAETTDQTTVPPYQPGSMLDV
ncbi:hypothetical protein G7Z17_g6250 [Cylindrodendrum hubeiense]|uniref:Uncharacterized protein n=1 Tax=Cylindrodendrum hubeiense TaxID=595255 RepID=A0A9P5HAA3_9HYPO|nr:hypothetical protein G7Z17_g6250 [Cylindrodendrum hubeiense]